jgi:NAD(P)-dependent dehydrogenase (short-subunit alcohol dehydrogenase family)
MSSPPPRVAVITGASQGIGAGLVAGYRSLGYAVVATSRTIEPVDDPMILTVPADVSRRGSAELVFEQAIHRFGQVDTLVNNAGVFIGKPFTDYTDEDYRAIMGVNCFGFFAMTQQALTLMAARGAGHVMSITTTLVEQADARVPAGLAALTKGGIAAATTSLAIEYAATGIRVNAVSPGVIKTPMHAGETDASMAELHPLRRAGDVEDVVRGALYLESSPFVTGEFLHVDGGQSAGH